MVLQLPVDQRYVNRQAVLQLRAAGVGDYKEPSLALKLKPWGFYQMDNNLYMNPYQETSKDKVLF